MTQKDFERLEQKLDKLLEQNEQILAVFNKVVLYPKEQRNIPNKKKSKVNWSEQFVQNYFRAWPHQKSLQEAFNLTTAPSTERVIKYLDTNDPKAFDGLKKNK